LSIGLIFFVTNCLLAYTPETNFWAERKKTKQLAQLHNPAPVSPIGRHSRMSLSGIQNISKKVGSLDSRLRGNDGIYSLPHHLGTIRKVTNPPSRDEGRGTRNGRIIFHIQDVHMNAEAQGNIGKTIQELIDNNAVDLVALEGAFGPMNLTPFRRYPYPDIMSEIADHFLKVQKISGPIHTYLTSSANVPPYVGVDDKQHYEDNVDAYRRSVKIQEPRTKEIQNWKFEIQKEKKRVFNKDLLEFDEKVEGYRNGTVELGEYVKFVNSEQWTVDRTVHSSLSTVRVFLEALSLESSLDLKKVESERARLITQIMDQLKPAQTKDLMNHTVAYRFGKMSHTDFYAYLKTICESNNIPLSQFPTMTSYIQYMLLTDRIDSEQLFQEITTLEKNLYGALATTPEEIELVREAKKLHLMGKLVDFALTSEEWAEYKKMTNVGAGFPRPTIEGAETAPLQSFTDFYRHAEARDKAMVENLLRAMDKHDAKTAVLVTGGFHSTGIEDYLEGSSCIVHGTSTAKHDARCTMHDAPTIISFTPRISKIEAQSTKYLSIFSQEKSPLDKILQGDKLFLATLPFAPVRTEAALIGVSRGIKRSGSDNPRLWYEWFNSAVRDSGSLLMVPPGR